MKITTLRTPIALAVVLCLFGISSSLHSAEFENKPVVISGDPAPSGGAFGLISALAINDLGAIAFLAQAAPGVGVYLVTDDQKIIVIPSGVNISDGIWLNNSGAMVFDAGFFTHPELFSGGARIPLRNLALHQILVDLSGDRFASIQSLTATALTNTGIVALKAFTIENSRFNIRAFLTTGETPVHFPLVGTSAPGGGTILDASILSMNDAGDALVRFVTSFGPFGPGPGGLFLDRGGPRIPIAIPGGAAVGTLTFRDVAQLARVNNSGEVVFVAQLSDFRNYVLRWTPDSSLTTGTLTTVARTGTPLPGGGGIFAFEHIDLNDNGDVAFVVNFNSGIFFIGASDTTGVPTKVARRFEQVAGLGTFQSLGPLDLNNQGKIVFRAELSTGRRGIFLASAEALELVAGIGTDPSAAGTETTTVGGEVVTARFPLGSTFFIQLAKKGENGSRVPLASTFDLESAALDPAITEPTLFPSNVVIEFDRQSTSDIKFFQAVHLGNVILNITPTDTSISPVKVRLVVNRPQSLGVANSVVTDRRTGKSYNLDEKLADLGHLRGIPPQMLKGQADVESNFDLRSYRYEPLSSDLAYMSSCAFRTTNCDLRGTPPYSLYRLATADGLLQGRDTVSEDISPRSVYFIVRNRIRRQINNTDQLVSAAEIYQINDLDQGWSQHSPARARLARANPSLLDFTAQTPLAASYGLLQILYPTAISPMQWRGVNGARNPSLLFDSNANLTAGGGSLTLGSNYVRRLFQRVNPTLSLEPAFSSKGTFEQAFLNAFQAYNVYREGYGGAILGASSKYEPLPSTGIFP